MRRIAVLTLGIVCVVGLAGCESWFKTDNPYFDSTVPTSKPKVTEAELIAESQRWNNKLLQDQEDEANRIAEAQRRAAVEFRTTVSRLTTEAQLAVAELEAKYEADAARFDADMAALRSSTDRRLADSDARNAAAMADLAAQRETTMLGLGALQTYGGAIPVVGGAVVGLAGLVAGQLGKRKAVDGAWDESKREAEAEFAKRDAAWDAASNDLLKTMLAFGSNPNVLAKITPAPTAATGT